MCGIAGIAATDRGRPPDRAAIYRMLRSMRHRGPDGEGHVEVDQITVGARRLAIVDISGGAQPASNETGTIHVVFNGEIYNHRELRRSLISRGHVFRGQCDTEVIVHLYEEYGPDCVRHLRGMFAFAVVDGSRLLLARDRLGIKPLYYALSADGETLIFASEIKAILQSGVIDPELNIEAFAASFAFGFPFGSETYFRGIRLLGRGQVMHVEVDGVLRLHAPTPYTSSPTPSDNGMALEEAQSVLWDTLNDSVSRHIDADVDISTTLSGGIDSTMLALIIASQREAPITTYTVADSQSHPDLTYARSVANSLGAVHIPVVLNFENYVAAIPEYVAATEAHGNLAGVSYHVLAAEIAKDFKVCIHGEGADELFGGYSEFIDPRALQSALESRLKLAAARGIALPPEVLALVESLASADTFDSYLTRIFAYNISDKLERFHLLPVDQGAMASSLEMRVPYLDDEVVSFVQSLPRNLLVRADIGVRKYLLRKLCLQRFGVRYADIVMRQKIGVPSSAYRFRSRFERLCDETLPLAYLENHSMGRYFRSKHEAFLFDVFQEIFCVHRGDAAGIGDIMDFMRMRAG